MNGAQAPCVRNCSTCDRPTLLAIYLFCEIHHYLFSVECVREFHLKIVAFRERVLRAKVGIYLSSMT